MNEPTNQASCIACGRSSADVPLLSLQFRRATIHICPQHLPLLIHDPASLIGRLPGAESLHPAEHHD